MQQEEQMLHCIGMIAFRKRREARGEIERLAWSMEWFTWNKTVHWSYQVLSTISIANNTVNNLPVCTENRTDFYMTD